MILFESADHLVTLALLAGTVLSACGTDSGSSAARGETGHRGEGSSGDGGGTSESGADGGGGVVGLHGQACETGETSVDDCSACFCGASKTFTCIFVPGCEAPGTGGGGSGTGTGGATGTGGDTGSGTGGSGTKGPEDYEGQPCTEGSSIDLTCATCFCTDAAIYQCALIADCSQPGTCQGSYPPESGCDTGWRCEFDEWWCRDDATCPKTAPTSSDPACLDGIVQAINPANGTCCSYDSSCEVPSSWEPCKVSL